MHYMTPNQCKSGDGGCSTCNVSGRYGSCRFGRPAQFHNNCMYFKFDEFCDNVEAQRFVEPIKTPVPPVAKAVTSAKSAFAPQPTSIPGIGLEKDSDEDYSDFEPVFHIENNAPELSVEILDKVKDILMSSFDPSGINKYKP